METKEVEVRRRSICREGTEICSICQDIEGRDVSWYGFRYQGRLSMHAICGGCIDRFLNMMEREGKEVIKENFV